MREQAAAPTPRPVVLWGAYTGWESGQFVDFENRVGEPADMVATFVHWGNESEFPLELANFAKANNKTLVIYWEAMDYNVASPNDARFSYDTILGGGWDPYIKSFVESVKNYDGRVILIPFEEMNGAWYSWSGTLNGNTPEKHIAAFRYLVNAFEGVNNVAFAWDVNAQSAPDTPENSIDKYYPGDEYVSYIGVNGFNFGDPWMNPEEIFGPALLKLEGYGKPIYIFSTASAEGPLKAEWIAKLGEFIDKNQSIRGFVWFNEDKERDWRVWSDEDSLSVFRDLSARLPD